MSVELYEYERLSPAPVMVVSAAAAAAYWCVVKKLGQGVPVFGAVAPGVGTKNSVHRTKIGHKGEIFGHYRELSFIEAVLHPILQEGAVLVQQAFPPGVPFLSFVWFVAPFC